MLAKLTKHEFKATGKLFLPLFGGVFLVNIFSKLAYSLVKFAFIDLDLASSQLGSVGYRLLNTFVNLFIGTSVVGIVAMVASTFIIGIIRFYKNLLGDEGYLMFTLPVSPKYLFLSKLIVTVCWSLLSFVVAGLCATVLTFDFVMTPKFFSQVILQLSQIGPGIVLTCMLVVVLLCAAMINSYLTFYTAMSVGAQWPNNRLAYSVLAYLGISFATQIVFSIITFATLNIRPNFVYTIIQAIDRLAVQSPLLFINGILLGIIVFCLVCSIPYYFITKYLLTKKLNLA